MSKHHNHKHVSKPVAAPVAVAPVVEPVAVDEPEVVAPPVMVRILSQRPGDLIIAEGTLKFNDIMEVSQETADMLLKMEPKLIRVL